MVYIPGKEERECETCKKYFAERDVPDEAVKAICEGCRSKTMTNTNDPAPPSLGA